MRITAEDVYKIRKVYRLTLEEMAVLCDCSTSLINKIEKGERILSERVQHKIIEEFKLAPEKLTRIIAIYNEYDGRKYSGN